jgi:hypothetical protein
MPRNEFVDLETLRAEDGVIAVISERRDSGRISFMLGREWDQGGETKRGPFLQRRHIASARQLLDQLEGRLDAIEDRTRAAARRA